MEWLAWRHVTVQNNIIHLSFHLSSHCPKGGGARGGERKGGGGVRGKKKKMRDAKQKNLLFWEMCEVNACLGKPHWHLTHQHQEEGEDPEIARNQMSTVLQGQKKLWGEIISDSKKYLCFLLHTVKPSKYHYPKVSANILPTSSPNNCQCTTLRESHFQMLMYLNVLDITRNMPLA